MNESKDRIQIKSGTELLWNVLSFCFALFAVCLLTSGLSPLFCALSVCFSACLFGAGRKGRSFLGTVAGALVGYALMMWTEQGGIAEIGFHKELWGEKLPTLSLDLRILGLIAIVCLGAMCAYTALCLKKRYARTVCVAGNTALLAVAQGAMAVLVYRGKYGVVHLPQLREKIALLCDKLGDLLENAVKLMGNSLTEEGVVYADALATSLVYSVPLYLLLWCGSCAFLMSFLMKRLMKKNGLLREGEEWIFLPQPVSGYMYLVIAVLSFVWRLSEPASPAVYGLTLLESFLSYAFLVPGLTAIRMIASRRRENGGGGINWLVVLIVAVLFPMVLPLFLNLLPIAGLALVLSQRARKKNDGQQNKQKKE